jgi:hypothetical protein
MSRKPTTTAADAPAHPLPTSGGCYTVEDGVLTPIAPGEADAPADPAPANTPLNTPLKEA